MTYSNSVTMAITATAMSADRPATRSPLPEGFCAASSSAGLRKRAEMNAPPAAGLDSSATASTLDFYSFMASV